MLRPLLKVAPLLAITLSPALAQSLLERDGPTATVASAVNGESLQINNNSAVAMDQAGNVAVAFNRFSGQNVAVLRGIDPDGDSVDFQAEPVTGLFGDTPTVGTRPGGRFMFSHFITDGDGDADLASVILDFAVEPAAAKVDDASVLTFRQREALALALELKEKTGCIPIRVGYVPARTEYEDVALILTEIPVSTGGYYIVHCQFGQNYYVRANYDTNPPTIGFFMLTNPPNRKGDVIPNSALPTVATALVDGQPLAVYAGQQATGGPALVSVLELQDEGDTLDVTDVLQLDQHPITFGSGPVLSACGHDEGPSHYWIAYTDSLNQATVVRIDGEDVVYQQLGRSNGPIDIACDDWGNAVVAWWSPEGNDSVEAAAFGPNGEILNRLTENIASTPFFVSVNVAINAAGEVAIVWAIDDSEVFMRRYHLTANVTIDGTLSGSMFSPGFSGEGFAFDIAEIGGVPSLVLYYFTYQPDGSGEMAWLVGSAPIEGNRSVVQVATGDGTVFGPDFDPGDVNLTPVGTVSVTFLSCRLALIETDAEGFGELRYVAQRLTNRPLEIDGQCGEGPAGTLDIDASWGGSMFSVARDGEGFFFDVVRVDDVPTLVLYYFTYLPDGSGRPAWLVGSGEIDGRSAVVEVGFGSGGSFGPGFDPTDVTITPWGTISVDWISCVEVRITYDGLWGSGNFTVMPLTGSLIGNTGLCVN